jgi:hypothetical protein
MSAQNQETTVLETFKIVRTLNRTLSSSDARDWKTFHSLFADKVTIDFGEIRPPLQMSTDALVAWARKSYGGVRSHHMLTNRDVSIDGDKATVTSHGRALHRQAVSRGQDFWYVHCRYEHDLVKTKDEWRVTRIKTTPTFQVGNPGLIDQAFRDAGQYGESAKEFTRRIDFGSHRKSIRGRSGPGWLMV